MTKRLKYWGWGYEGDGLSASDRDALLDNLAARFGISGSGTGAIPGLDDLSLPPPRLAPPAGLAHLCTQDPYERVLHSFGQSQPDSIRIFARDFAHAPDAIAYPRHEAEVAALLDWTGEGGPLSSRSEVVRRSWAG